MASAFRISCPSFSLKGSIVLETSKSISNRALIIQSLCDQPFLIENLSMSDDTKSLQAMLLSTSEVLHSGHAGTSYRFMVARACLLDREVIIDGTPQLRRRPIGPLVRALQQLGADISYEKKEGFPPVRIKPTAGFGKLNNEITLQTGVSSQFLTALLMIAPKLPNGLIIQLSDDLVSESYVKMTLAMMNHFGVKYEWDRQTIRIPHSKYEAKPFKVEADWSAASYFYSMVALAAKAEIHLEGLHEISLQGDAIVKEIYHSFGVETTFVENGIQLKKGNSVNIPKEFTCDFSDCPDLAQTVMVTLAGLGINGNLMGLKTLRIKETDRIAAMQTELGRVKTTLETHETASDIQCTLHGKAKWKDKAKFNTYEDHRMAMAFTPLACLKPIVIKEPYVVSKSYPDFWKDCDGIGMKVEKL